jgi:hypothetical protein
MGIASLMVCYLLCILLWLQVHNQLSSTAGNQRSRIVRHRNFIVISVIIVYLGLEVTVRILWATMVSHVELIIGLYHVMIFFITLCCTLAFIVLSTLLYRELRDVTRTAPATRFVELLSSFEWPSFILSHWVEKGSASSLLSGSLGLLLLCLQQHLS